MTSDPTRGPTNSPIDPTSSPTVISSLSPSQSKIPTPSPVEPIMGTCSTSSMPCSSDTDCVVKKCSGGLQNGDTCAVQSDCPDAIAGVCQGGINNGIICTTNDDNLSTGCPDALGSCDSGFNIDGQCSSASGCSVNVCEGGKNSGDACSTDDDCPNKGPKNEGTCGVGTGDASCIGYSAGSCDVTNTGQCLDVSDDVCVDILPPVKVFILTGQSNNRGQGSILLSDPNTNRKDLNTLIASANTSPLYSEYGITYSHLGPGTTNTGQPAADNSFAERDDVFIHYYNDQGPITSGKLGLGYGQNPLTHSNPKFGPEVGFGWVLGDADKHPIFLIKAGWGGKSLSTEFRPPSADCVLLDAFGCTTTTQSWNGTCCAFGEYYHITLDRIKASISKIEAGDFDSLIPNFSARGFEIAGFLYFQGFNDVLNRENVDEHEELLKHYMSDMRSEQHGLNVTDLPFVIGELGMHGPEVYWSGQGWNSRVRDFRAAQANAAAATSNAELAPTSQYMYPPKDITKVGNYHYGDRADTFHAMGLSMGKTMRDLVYPQQAQTAEDPFK